MSGKNKRRVAVGGGARTPFAKAGAQLRGHSALDLATHAVNGALDIADLDSDTVDELAFGTVIVDPAIPHIAREVNFRSDLPSDVRAVTITDNCITGTSAIQSVHNSIALGRADIGIAGGVECMSNPPVMFRTEANDIFLRASRRPSIAHRIKATIARNKRRVRPVFSFVGT